jgi:hypothetical protein
MAAEPFNSLGGYTVGIPPVAIIDSNGNVITNLNAPSANVTANAIYANYYNFANGATIITNAAGVNTQVQYNNNGNFGASSSFTFNASSNLVSVANLKVSNVANLGNVENVRIFGGLNGYFLQTDGVGNLTWAAGGNGGGGNGNPGGANMQVQYNDAGTFGGDAGFIYDKDTNILTITEIVTGNITANYIVTNWDVSANVVYANYLYGDGSNISNVSAALAAVANTVSDNAQPNITSVGTLTSLSVSGNITSGNANLGNAAVANFFIGSGANLTNLPAGNIVGTVANANYAAFAGNVVDAAQPNITSLGTLTSLSVTGNVSAGNASLSGTLSTTNIQVSGNANISVGATLRSLGDVNFIQSPNVSLGNVSNIKILGGVNGYVLSTDGAGNLNWVAGGGGGNGTPGGSNTQIQYNDSGVFGGSAFFTFNESTNNVQIAGNLIANAVTIGSGIYQFSYSNVYFATTSSTSPNQVLLAIEADNGVGGGNIAAVDYTIISTDDTIRNFIKISCVRMNSQLNYVEYSTLPINGYTGDFQVVYNAGNVISPATIQLILTPQNANLMTHKMMITAYYD